ncbi:MAG: hypothetical protein WCR69_01895 [Sulfuricurvum sp.]
MELKDMILSTIVELQEQKSEEVSKKSSIVEVVNSSEVAQKAPSRLEQAQSAKINSNELVFLHSLRERLLVLFEGFNAPNNTNIEAKLDLTLNFLEYVLALLDDRIDEMERNKMQSDMQSGTVA